MQMLFFIVLVLYLGLIPGAVLVFSNQILCHGWDDILKASQDNVLMDSVVISMTFSPPYLETQISTIITSHCVLVYQRISPTWHTLRFVLIIKHTQLDHAVLWFLISWILCALWTDSLKGLFEEKRRRLQEIICPSYRTYIPSESAVRLLCTIHLCTNVAGKFFPDIHPTFSSWPSFCAGMVKWEVRTIVWKNLSLPEISFVIAKAQQFWLTFTSIFSLQVIRTVTWVTFLLH